MRRYLPVMMVLLLAACSSPQRLLEKGKDDKALKASMNKLKSGRVKSKDLSTFEEAFYIVNERDKAQILSLRKTGQPDIWPKIYDKATAIADRQEKVDNLLQRLKSKGHYPNIEFFEVDPIIEESATKSAQYFYAKAGQRFEAARTGNRKEARAGHRFLSSCLEYRPGFKNAENLQSEMLDLGTAHVLVSVDARFVMPRLVEDIVEEIFDNQSFPYRDGWQVVHIGSRGDVQMNYRLDLLIDNVDISGNLEERFTCSNSKEVENGYIERQVWSESDSTWVTERETQYKTVTVTVNTIRQSKAAGFDLAIEGYNLDVGRRVDYEITSADAFWENIYSDYTGEREAMDSDCEDEGGSRRFYPDNDDLLVEAAEGLRNKVFDQLEKLRD